MLCKRTYHKKRSQFYSALLGQCSDAMKGKLEDQDDWETIQNEHNLVNVLKSIKVWMLSQQTVKALLWHRIRRLHPCSD